MSNLAIENGPVEIVDFPINSMVDLSIAMLVYQRIYMMISTNHPQIWIDACFKTPPEGKPLVALGDHRLSP